MRSVCSAAILLLTTLGISQGQSLSITDFQFVGEQFYSRTQSFVKYRATLVNSGAALSSVTATLTSTTANIQVVSGQDSLHFAPVPAQSRVPSSDMFTILVDRTVPFDFSSLEWTFQTPPTVPPIAKAGADQSVKVGQAVTLNGSGSSNPSGIGTLTYDWEFTSRPAGSTATLNSGTGVMATFVADVAGYYIITLTVGNGVASATASTTVSTTTPPRPVADAGADQAVAMGSTVILNGSKSSSGSGSPLTYAWTLTAPAGSTANLMGANTVTPTFVADKSGSYAAQLIVNDGLAGSTPSSVTVTTQVVKPVARAGSDQVVNVNSTVQLNGTASTDANGLPLTYQWSLITLPAGSAAALNHSTAVNPTFTTDRPGSYVAQLIVNNGVLDSDAATVMVTTNPVVAPTANAGVNQTVDWNSTVQLSGSGTDPQNLPLTYQWSLIHQPANSSSSLSGATSATPTFTADRQGDYVAQLVVSNGALASSPSTVTISTTCAPPTANAGSTQVVAVGATVTLDASASGDVCQDPLTYSWSFTSRPDGSASTLSGVNTAMPTFTADLPGIYVAQVIVNNGFTNSTPATVTAIASSLSLSPGTSTITGLTTQTLLLNLSTGLPSDLTVQLKSSNPGVVAVQASVTIPANATSIPVLVTSLGQGSSTITASASSLGSATATVTVRSDIILPANPTVMVGGEPLVFPVSLANPAPAGGVIITLTSSDPSKVTTTVQNVLIHEGETTSLYAKLNGIAFGTSTITAEAYGYVTATTTAVATSGALAFVPPSLSITGDGTQNLMLALSPISQVSVTVDLSSSDPTVASVPATVTIPANANSVTVPVMAGQNGSAVIHASGATLPDTTADVDVNIRRLKPTA